MEIELKISNGNFLTHEDLENFLKTYDKFLYDSFKKEKMLEFEWVEFSKHHNNIIENQIKQFSKIDLIVENISKVEFSGYELEDSICLNGEELGNWNGKNNRRLVLEDVYEFEFKFIKNNISYFPIEPHFPISHIGFKKFTTEKPTNLKKGDRLIFNMNILKIVRDRYDETRPGSLYYYEKINVLPPENESNSNCFVVTTTMGDSNHPVVVDFRKYRDEVLLENNLGRLFIKLYYKIGPSLSEIIKNNKTLFQISRSFILKLHKRIFKK